MVDNDRIQVHFQNVRIGFNQFGTQQQQIDECIFVIGAVPSDPFKNRGGLGLTDHVFGAAP